MAAVPPEAALRPSPVRRRARVKLPDLTASPTHGGELPCLAGELFRRLVRGMLREEPAMLVECRHMEFISEISLARDSADLFQIRQGVENVGLNRPSITSEEEVPRERSQNCRMLLSRK